jgi:hypothetical protein
MTNPFIPKHDTLQCDHGCCRAGKYALGHTASSTAAAKTRRKIKHLTHKVARTRSKLDLQHIMQEDNT